MVLEYFRASSTAWKAPSRGGGLGRARVGREEPLAAGRAEKGGEAGFVERRPAGPPRPPPPVGGAGAGAAAAGGAARRPRPPGDRDLAQPPRLDLGLL